MIAILLGAPGVGKGTQAVRLADETGAAHVSTGDLLRTARRQGTELGRKAQSYMDAGELVPDGLILDLVREHLTTLPRTSDVLLDGFPRTIAQAEGLDDALDEVGLEVGRVVLFEAPDETLVKRLAGRRTCTKCGAVYNTYFGPPERDGVCDRCGGELVQRPDDEPQTVRRRLEVYTEQTEPLIAYYENHDTAELVRIEADRLPEAVFEDFRQVVGGGTPA